MYRLLPGHLPKDPTFPHDLKGLGYFINDKDYIKSISEPAEDFDFFVTKSYRHNKMRGEAMSACMRKLVLERLEKLSLPILRLPIGTLATEPHVPILASPDLSSKKRLVVVLGEAFQDLGIWAYRSVGREGLGGINDGSAINFVKEVQKAPLSRSDDSDAGIIIANPGQLLWWRRGKQPVTFQTWYALPRKSAVHGPRRIDDVKNRVPGNGNCAKHVEYVFNEVVAKLAREDVKLYVLGVADGGTDMLSFLNKNWSTWESRISAIALSHPLHIPDDVSTPRFASFMSTHARAYLCHDEPANTPVSDTDYGCPTFSSGESQWAECIMTKASVLVVDWFREMANGEVEGLAPEAVKSDKM
ncbi:MAG: hypothetical protein M1833_006030 [Piccolia ochrophora]|nr:MAG: hypothetical protein M1833_006030 [Piccolia ochrophora]